MPRGQWRILFRQFLFRIVDQEILSSYSSGDLSRLFAQVAAVLVFISAAVSLPAIDHDSGSATLGAWNRLTFENFLIATTMLVTGIVAILGWSSMFPDARDLQVLAPLPIRAGTILRAKAASVVALFGAAVLALHAVAGLIWPMILSRARPPQPLPTYARDTPLPPVRVTELQRVLDGDLQEALTRGWLAPSRAGGLSIAVSQRGVRRIFSYGVARPDSIFQIGSVTKTFTGVLLARQIDQGRVRLDSPLREFLPESELPPAAAGDREITLGDLVTHRSGLPTMPISLSVVDRRNPFVNIGSAQVYAFLRRNGTSRPAEQPFVYSNMGFGLLGDALARASHVAFDALLREQVTGPLGLADTVFTLTAEQQQRLVQGHDEDLIAVRPTLFEPALAPAGGLYSTAPDLLTWLEANLHPTGTLARAVQDSHVVRAAARGDERIALAWIVDPTSGNIGHDGSVVGYTADVFLNPAEDLAAVVLSNVVGTVTAAPMVADHIRARLSGRTPVSLTEVVAPASHGVRSWPRALFAYWTAMLAAAVFVVGLVMGVQGIAVAILPRRRFLRVSWMLQLTAFLTLIGWYLLQPIFITHEAMQAAHQRGIMSSPSYWFLGLLQSLNGSQALAPLAWRAWRAVLFAAVAAVLSYAVSYAGTLRRIGEEPDVAIRSRRLPPLPLIGHGPVRGLVGFTLKTLFRSAHARVVMAWYWGIGFALAIGFIKTPRGQGLAVAGEMAAVEPTVPLLVAGILVMGAAIVAARSAFAIPRDPAAKWIFKVIPLAQGETRAARRVALLAVTVLPVVAIAAAIALWNWRWLPALGHLLLLALFGLGLIEVADRGAGKIPFVSDYLPGRARIHFAIVVTFTVVVPLAVAAAEIERDALRNVWRYAATAIGLAAFWMAAWSWSAWRTRAAAGVGEPLDDPPADAVLMLQLWDSRPLVRTSVRSSP